MPKRRNPTDLALLNHIYQEYYDDFAAFSGGDPARRAAKVLVPIDIAAIAGHFDVDVDIVFGRLYYHLNEKYGYSRDDGSKVSFFAPVAGADRNCVNFPYLASVAASLTDEGRQWLIPTLVAFASLIVAVTALGVAVAA